MNSSTPWGGILVIAVATMSGCSQTGDGARGADAVAEPAVEAEAASPQSVPAPETAMPEPVSVAMPTTAAISNDADQASLAAQAEAQLESEAPSQVPGESPGLEQAHAQVHVAAVGINKAAIATQAHSMSAASVAAEKVGHATPQATAATAVKFNRLAEKFQPPVLLAETKEPQVLYSLKLGTVGISNLDDDARVYFAMKSMLSDWRNESLDPDDTRPFDCAVGNGTCVFWMQTGQKPAVSYSMRSQQRYAIVWDGQKEMWDLRLTKQGE